ncbi:MAG: caspase family protein [Anaerolineae bacterium]|nr:caspase family protein [Anaerolineae bacterium]
MCAQFTNGYALLIGVADNSVARWALPGVAKDIAVLQAVLLHPGRCAYPTGQVKVVAGREATQTGILDGLDWLQGRVRADAEATAVIYYSGHGWRDSAGAFYLIPYDVRADRVPFTALRAVDFADRVAALQPPRLLVVLDCCHAAGMGVKDVVAPPAGYVAAALPPAVLLGTGGGAKSLAALAQGRGRAALSSSSGEQASYMRQDGSMSVFTYHLIEALTGHAQPKEGATTVLVSDVMSHVYRRVPETVEREHGQQQTPDFQVSGNFPVALLLGGKGLGKGLPPPDPLAEMPAAAAPAGGLWVGGHLINTGNLVAGDQTIHGDLVWGDKIAGDKVGGDKIQARDIAGSSGVALGRGARLTATQGVNADELARLFKIVYERIEARPDDPDVDKEELIDTARQIEQEVNKGESANANKVERWLGELLGMADDIFDVVVACLSGPAAGVAAVIRKVVARAKAEREAKQKPHSTGPVE